MSETFQDEPQRPRRLIKTKEKKNPLRPEPLQWQCDGQATSHKVEEVPAMFESDEAWDERTNGLGFAIGQHLLVHHKSQNSHARLPLPDIYGNKSKKREGNIFLDAEELASDPLYAAGSALSQPGSDIHPDWAFLQRMPALSRYSAHSECPSLVSGSTMSSRNSSTRSAKSFRWDAADDNPKGVCPMPECGRAFKDLATHMLTHQTERPEKCPVESCDWHVKALARPYDRVRHTLSHYKEAMACGFCVGSAAQKTFVGVDTFLRHLTSTHGAEPRRKEPRKTTSNSKSQSQREGSLVASCTLCSEPFDAQGFYEHLPGCVLRQITRSVGIQNHHPEEPKESPRNDSVVTTEDSCHSLPTSSDRPSSPSRRNMSKQPRASSELRLLYTASHMEPESKEIEELTASSRCLSLTSSKAVESSDEETDWTEDPGSRESTPDAPSPVQRRLSPIKRQLVDSIMQEFHRLFDQTLQAHGGASGGGGGNASSPPQGYGGSSSSGSSTYSSSSFISRKRSLSGGSPPPDDGDDPHKRRRPDPKFNGKQPAAPELRFACPYYKRNPGRHQTFTSCRDPGFITVARLKEHLYRRHLLPPQCNRCCATFSNDVFLREHQRDTRGCEVRESIPLEGFDKDQERRLKSKKRSLVYQSEEDKWKGVYHILFPDDNEADMPSPYIEYQPCNGGQVDNSSDSNITRFQDFSRLELPRLVRRTLEVVVEQEAQPLEERLKDQLVDIVKECQNQLISMFRSTGGASEDAPQLTPATIPSAGPSQQIMPRSNVPAEVPFNGFDSIQIPVSGDIIPTQQYQYQPLNCETQKLKPSSVDGTSGSPDSGYDSTWTNTSFPHDATFRPGPALPQMDGFAENEYVNLGGYYGLFENRNMQFDPAAQQVDPSSWTYLDPTTSMVIPHENASLHHAGGTYPM